jgi:hypothetical protein
MSEFTRWWSEESKTRERLERRMESGFSDLKRAVDEVAGLQRAANGKTAEHARMIAVMERDVAAIKSAEVDVAETVHSIQQEGCHQYESHRAALGVLEGSGAMMPTEGPPSRSLFVMPALTVRQKAVAGVGVTALLLPAVVELVKLATALASWLQTIHAVPR